MAVETVLLLTLAVYYVVGIGSAVYCYWPYIAGKEEEELSEIEMTKL